MQTLKAVTTKTMYLMTENFYLPCLIIFVFITDFDLLDVSTWLPTFCLTIGNHLLISVKPTLVFVLVEVGLGYLLKNYVLEDANAFKMVLDLWANNMIDVLPLGFIILSNSVINSINQTVNLSQSSGTIK